MASGKFIIAPSIGDVTYLPSRPDKCNNQFYENCDKSRAYSGSQIVAALQSAGQNNLVDFMNTYWVSNDESSPDFWSHEVSD